jgi:hypothetical protein
MLAGGDVPRWWLLSEGDWFEIIIFFLTATAELPWLRRRRVNPKLDDVGVSLWYEWCDLNSRRQIGMAWMFCAIGFYVIWKNNYFFNNERMRLDGTHWFMMRTISHDENHEMLYHQDVRFWNQMLSAAVEVEGVDCYPPPLSTTSISWSLKKIIIFYWGLSLCLTYVESH